MRQRKAVRVDAIVRRQQPSVAPFANRVEPVAQRRLRHQREQRLRVQVQHVPQCLARPQVPTERGDVDDPHLSRNLHHRLRRGCGRPEENGQADHPLATDGGDFDADSIDRGGEQRGNSALGKVDRSNGLPDREQQRPRVEIGAVRATKQGGELRPRQRSEDAIRSLEVCRTARSHTEWVEGASDDAIRTTTGITP